MPSLIIIIGASGIIAQIVLIRELLVIFQGNELSIGIILGNWLIAEALGSYLFRKVRISQKSYQALIFGFALLFPMLGIITKLLRLILGVTPGEIITIPMMYLSSLIILLPVSFLHGALFTSSVSVLIFQNTETRTKTAGKVYVLENIGTIIGGVIISFLLIPYLSSLQIGFFIGIINLFALLILLKHKQLVLKLIKSILIILLGILFFSARKIEKWTLAKTYPNYNIITSANTIYSNITVIKREEQYSYLVDGTPTIITPLGDQLFIEDFVNFPLLSHNNPKRILLISGGAGGVLSQMVKYPITQIDYVELDPGLIKNLRQNPTELTEQELTDPKVKIINIDARFFIEQYPNKYDIIFINFLTSLSLQTNRFFTKEFFEICRTRLNQDGILVTLTPGSLSYISPTMRNLIKSHFKTLQQVFLRTSIIPGDYNLYLSCNQPAFGLNPESLHQRLLVSAISTDVFNLNYLKYRTQKNTIDWFYNSLDIKTDKVLINSDGKPLGLFYSLYYWNTIANPSLKSLFRLISTISFKTFIVIILLFFIIFFLIAKKADFSINLPFAIFSTGVVAMIFSLVISLSFQIRYGYLYYQISILLTTFIAGTTLGGYLGNTFFPIKRKYFLLLELTLIILLLILTVSLVNRAYPSIFGSQIDFFIFLIFSGILAGLEFPLASKIYNFRNPQIAVGHLYTADLLGGFLGAVTISMFLIPVLGIFQTLIFAIILKVVSAGLILTAKRFSIK